MCLGSLIFSEHRGTRFPLQQLFSYSEAFAIGEALVAGSSDVGCVIGSKLRCQGVVVVSAVGSYPLYTGVVRVLCPIPPLLKCKGFKWGFNEPITGIWSIHLLPNSRVPQS